ncbi:MAG: M67 family metallopeptidase [Pyrinomonadaceae bacterium]
MFTLLRANVEEMFAHARASDPLECCGLIGGVTGDGDIRMARTVYRLRNAAANPRVAYEAAPEELFAAQKFLRGRGEQLLGIYHSHPRSIDPVPSEADVRLAFYPSAVYFIIGLGGEQAVLRAFLIDERERRWEPFAYRVADAPESNEM